MSDLFVGTADDYRRYRPPYPAAAIDWIVSEHGLDGRGCLLDCGCGTGHVFSALGRWFAHTIAVDPDGEMLEAARRTAREHGVSGQTTCLQSRAEDLSTDLAPVKMAVFGSSFHWTDRTAVATLLDRVVEPNGALVILSPSSLWVEAATGWKGVVMDTIRDWIGQERRAGSGRYGSRPKHQECLKRTPFCAIKEATFTQRHIWTADTIAGYLFSTSFASRAVLGSKADDFQADLRSRLDRFDPNGQFVDAIEVSVISAKRQ
jgi:ubiquinone/menaquinone biosynthesis C-methylase UbiE